MAGQKRMIEYMEKTDLDINWRRRIRRSFGAIVGGR
jgi:hypothetical protein